MPRSRSSEPKPTASPGSSATSSISRSWTRTGSRSSRRRSTSGGCSSRRTRDSSSWPAGGRSTTSRAIDGAPVLTTDGDRVLQVVSNLLANAFEWTPDGGRVALGSTPGPRELVVSVSDTGPGIPPGEQERVFRPFWSGQRAGHGSRPCDRPRAGTGARRAAPAGLQPGRRLPLRPRPAGAVLPPRGDPARARREPLGRLTLRSRRAGPAAPRAGATTSRAGRASSTRSTRSSVRSSRSMRRSTPRHPDDDQVDDERQVLDPRLALRGDIGAEALEPADRLRGEPAHLGEMAGDGQHLGPQRVVQGVRDALGERRLELRGALGERLELLAGALERRGELISPVAAFDAQDREPRPGPLDRIVAHEPGL